LLGLARESNASDVGASYQQRYACEYIQQRLQSWPAAEKFFII